MVICAAVLALGQSSLPPLEVKGPLLVQGGRAVRLTGINVPSLEWSTQGENVLRSVRTAMDDWGANCIRLPLSQDRWFGKEPGQTDGGAAYRSLVDAALAAVESRKGWMILDLHWSNGGIWGRHMQQHKMPDQHSTAFWVNAARRYRGRASVLFDLYNEPRDVDWKTWRDGGPVTNPVDGGGEVSYQSPGMQGLIHAIRKAGAKNIIVAGGLDWGYDLSGVVDGFALKDPGGRGIVYSSHIYPWKTEWDHKVGRAAKLHPVFIGEVGCEPDPKQEDPLTWGPKVMDWMDKNSLHYAAWCYHPSASPRMLQDWNYTPTPYWGALAKARLQEARLQEARRKRG